MSCTSSIIIIIISSSSSRSSNSSSGREATARAANVDAAAQWPPLAGVKTPKKGRTLPSTFPASQCAGGPPSAAASGLARPCFGPPAATATAGETGVKGASFARSLVSVLLIGAPLLPQGPLQAH
ncbi:hypothetical protein Esti_006210 [Eimeria stiedai]